MWHILSVFSSSKCILFQNSNIFGSCIIKILYTGCAKIKKNNSGAERLNVGLLVTNNCGSCVGVNTWRGTVTALIYSVFTSSVLFTRIFSVV